MTTSSITSQSTTSNPRTTDQEDHLDHLMEGFKDDVLEEINPDRETLQRFFSRGGEFKAYYLAGFRRFSMKAPDYELARKIFGKKDFLAPEEVAKSRRLIYPDEQLLALGNSLPSEEDLVWCRDNDMVFMPGAEKPTSLLDVRALKSGYFYSKEGGWFSEVSENFSRNDKVDPGWIAFRKDVVSDSLSRSWSDQQVLVKTPMFVPNVGEAVWCLTTYAAVRGTRLLPNIYGRTSSLDSNGLVDVGHFDDEGLDVNDCEPDVQIDRLGVLSARKWALKS